MTYQSTWRRAMAGAKLGLGATVVAGVMAFSGTAQAATFSGSPNTIMSSSPQAGTGSAPLTHPTVFVADAVYPFNSISIGDGWNISLSTVQDGGSAGNPFYNTVGFEATQDLVTLSTTVQNPESSFENVQAGWATSNDGVSGTFFDVPNVGDLFLSTTLALGQQVFLTFRWWGDLFPEGGVGAVALNTNLNAVVIPLPAGLVLFLSGLVGIGFLGRYKAKRRREEPAAA